MAICHAVQVGEVQDACRIGVRGGGVAVVTFQAWY